MSSIVHPGHYAPLHKSDGARPPFITHGSIISQQFSTTDSADITVPLPQLDAGTYVLSWKVVGDDTHVVDGQMHFTVSGAPAQH